MSDVGVRLLAELDEQALAQVARADAGRVEPLDDREHLLDLGHGVRAPLAPGVGRAGSARARPRDASASSASAVRREMPGHQLVDAAEDLLERGGEIALFVDVAQELLAEQQLARA